MIHYKSKLIFKVVKFVLLKKMAVSLSIKKLGDPTDEGEEELAASRFEFFLKNNF